MTIDDALERFVLQLRADGRSLHTRKQYERHVRLLGHWCRDVAPCGDDIHRLDHEAIATFLASDAANTNAHGGTKKATSTNCLRSSLKGFFSYLHKAGYLRHDPSRLGNRSAADGSRC